MHIRKALVITLLVLATTACKEKAPPVDELGRANAPAQTATPKAMPRPTTPQENDGTTVSTGKTHQGVILETTDVRDYTYIHFRDKEGLEHWAAVLKGVYETGQKIDIVESIVMKNFTSPTLSKTFDSIIFGNVTKVDGAEPAVAAPAASDMPPGHPPVPMQSDETAPKQELPKGHPAIN